MGSISARILGLADARQRRERDLASRRSAIELCVSDDELTWAAARGPTFFLEPDDPPPSSAVGQRLGNRAEATSPVPSAVPSRADYYLVAHALPTEHTVVTHEVASTSTKKIKIPDACMGLGVKCMTPFAMLRAAGARFVRA